MDQWLSPERAADLIAQGRGRGVKVAVIDSGIETAHPQLAGLTVLDDVAIVSDDLQLVTQAGTGTDVYGHGTAVAGIIHQIAPEATLGSFRVLDARSDSKSAIVCEAVRQALDRGYQILNCSFGCGVLAHVLEYKAWVDDAYLKRVHVVAACNNDDFTTPEWPGFFPSVITVNMADTQALDRFWYRVGNLVEFAAAGVGVDVAWKGQRTRNVTGSSFAAPRVAGLLARLLSEAPDLRPLEVKALFHRFAQPWRQELIGPNMTYSE